MSTPCISVIVPVYNTEKFLYKCIESIIKQTFSDLELILVDDGSTDNSGAICDEYAKADSRVRVFHQENGGVSKARNVGIDNAKGEYITFVDSDDYIASYALELLYMDIITFKADISCAGGRKKYSNAMEAIENGKYQIWRDNDAIQKSLMSNGHTNSACRKLYKKDFIGEIRFEEGRKIHEDGFFIFCCFLKKPLVVVRNANIYCYRSNPDSASNSAFSDKFFDVLYFVNRKKELINEMLPEFNEQVNTAVIRANLIMLQILCRADRKKYKKEIKECIQTVKKLRKHFVPINSTDKKFFIVVKNNLYCVYRMYYNLKRKKK